MQAEKFCENCIFCTVGLIWSNFGPFLAILATWRNSGPFFANLVTSANVGIFLYFWTVLANFVNLFSQFEAFLRRYCKYDNFCKSKHFWQFGIVLANFGIFWQICLGTKRWFLGTKRCFLGTPRWFFGTKRWFFGTKRWFLVLIMIAASPRNYDHYDVLLFDYAWALELVPLTFHKGLACWFHRLASIQFLGCKNLATSERPP